MLLRFRVENCRSFRQEGELSMIQSSLKGPEVATKSVPQFATTKTLPAALIYGANASGKSNLLKAIEFYARAIIHSHRRADPKSGVPRITFATEHDKALHSSFEADFVANGVRCTLGFTCNDQQFLEEWLYSYPEGKKRIMYERSGVEVEFGSKFTGAKKQLVEFMRPNSLFIATATQNDHPELTPISEYISTWEFVSYTSASDIEVNSLFSRKELDNRIVSFLDHIGTGVVDVHKSEKELPENFRGFKKDLLNVFRSRLGDDLGGKITIEDDDSLAEIELGHRGPDGDIFFLDLERESSGTRRILLLMASVFEALDQGKVLFVDELDASLHTLAAEEILGLFLSSKTNRRGGQLLATTHDTNLLGSTALRRDQVWFCERDHEGASNLYSLAEIKSRQHDNFERGYLEGRYGAIPYAGDIALLFGADE